jgi:hypothetical protein
MTPADARGAYVRSKNGAWHVLAEEIGDRAVTDCGLALRGGFVDTLPPKRPLTRPCLMCRWPDGYPRWES